MWFYRLQNSRKRNCSLVIFKPGWKVFFYRATEKGKDVAYAGRSIQSDLFLALKKGDFFSLEFASRVFRTWGIAPPRFYLLKIKKKNKK